MSRENKERFIEAMESIIYHNGHSSWLKILRDDMENFLNTHDQYENYPSPFELDEWGTETHVIFMILVGMFGNWGISIRSGWIEDMEGCIEFIDTIRKMSCEEGGKN